MKKPSIRTRILEYLNNHSGEHKTCDIAAAIGASLSSTSTELSKLAKAEQIKKIQGGTYTRIDKETSAETHTDDTLERIANVLRAADANKETIDRLLNIYDIYLHNYESWVKNNIGPNIDFEKQLLCIENFKWLTGIGDKLMKRWSLEHVGYDTNARQAQEDAKAKTAEREKAALEDAPLEETVQIVGHYHTDLKELWDAMPPSEKEKRKV